MDTTDRYVTWYRLDGPTLDLFTRRPTTGPSPAPSTPAAPKDAERGAEMRPGPGRQTVTVEEAAAILGLGRSAAYEAVRRGEIPSLRVGRRLLVPVPALDALLGAR